MNISKLTVCLFSASALLIGAGYNNFFRFGRGNHAQPTCDNMAVMIIGSDGTVVVNGTMRKVLVSTCQNPELLSQLSRSDRYICQKILPQLKANPPLQMPRGQEQRAVPLKRMDM